MNTGLSSATPTLRGTGLFSGTASAVVISPREGGVTIRVAGATIAARIENVTADTSWTSMPAAAIRNTTLRAGTPARYAATVEHLMAALAGLGVWGADVELEGVEVPILDGSALAFAEAIQTRLGGTGREAEPLRLDRRVEAAKGAASIVAEPLGPGETLSYTYHLDFGPGAALGPQSATWDGTATAFLRDLAPARTFSFEHEARAARAAGLFAHLSPRDMLVIDAAGRPIDNQWRVPDEAARHKLLDLIGDLALLGRPLQARVTARGSGHALAQSFAGR